MTAQDFAMWLQGFAELNTTPPTPEQWQSIREHLQTVFVKVTPPAKTPEPMKPNNVEIMRKFFEDVKKNQAQPSQGMPDVYC